MPKKPVKRKILKNATSIKKPKKGNGGTAGTRTGKRQLRR